MGWVGVPMSTFFEDGVIRIIQHPGQGFFSCCTIHLQRILTYFNEYHELPLRVDSTQQFLFYKTPYNWTEDIKERYFDSTVGTVIPTEIPYTGEEVRVTDSEVEEQYSDYRLLNHARLAPFMRRYFTPSEEILSIVDSMEYKYGLDYSKTCVLFFRGNDKCTEMTLPSYDTYIEKGRQILAEYPGTRFLIQSDETEFLEAMTAVFPDSVVFYDEIRHMPRCVTTVDKVFKPQNADMSMFYLAITVVMSRCRQVVFGGGNCSLWITLFRGHSDGIIQLGLQD